MNRLLRNIRAALTELVRRPAFLPLLALAILYSLVFVAPNSTGAHDKNMLAAFQLDEYVQFGVISRMLTPKSSFLMNVVDFVVYRHYFYGYPFYLASAIFTSPLWIVSGFASPAELSQAYMLTLRFMSLVTVAAAVVLMIAMWDGLQNVGRALFFFLFFGVTPAVVFNNSWWHPDGLLTLLVVLTIGCLYRDDLRFGRWFLGAAVFCGLATGVKVIGLFFGPTIAVYLLLGLRAKRLGWAQLFRHGALFVGVMVLTIIVSNPLLLIPRTSRQIIDTMVLQATGESQRGSSRGLLAWYEEQLRWGFGYWWIYLAGLGACIYGIVRGGPKALLSTLILTWALPFSVYCISVVTFKKSYYFIPILLPLFSCLLNPAIWNFRGFARERRWGAFALAGSLVALYLANLPFYMSTNAGMYRYFLNKEAESGSLAFYQTLAAYQGGGLPPADSLTIFRDPYVYVPPDGARDVRMKWGAASYADLADFEPDLILLQQEYIERHADAAAPSTGTAAMSSSGRFYDDARSDVLVGYRKILETEFGVAFLRSGPATAQESRP